MHKNQDKNFAAEKQRKREKRTRKRPKREKPGAFRVLGRGAAGADGWETRNPNQNAPNSNATRAKRKPAETQSFRRFFGRGRRTWSRLPPRSVRGRAPLALAHPTTRTAQGAAVPRCQILPHTNEKSQVSQKRYLTFLAGAEGLEPSARGFGVDVGTHQRERRRGGVARSPRSSPQRAVLIWCYEESEVEKACRAISFSSPTTISFCLYRATGVGNEITTC